MASHPIPDWIAALQPNNTCRTSDESWLCEWQARSVRIEFYDNGYVVAMAPDTEFLL